MRTIAIIGANGYTGQHLVEHFSKNYRVIAVHRSAFPVLRQISGVSYINIYDDVPFLADVIINTAFSTQKNIRNNFAENTAIAHYIKQHAHTHTKIIHLSTLAVFGIKLEKEIKPIPVKNRMDYLYVESKIHAENTLLKILNKKNLQILRLGNIWGEANNTWTTGLLNALLFGTPCKHSGVTFCNITYIKNLVAYIDYVIHADKIIPFHHVAELSHVPWQHFIEAFSKQLQVESIALQTLPPYAKSMLREMDITLLNRPYGLIKKLKNGRFLQSRINNALENIPSSLKRIVTTGQTKTGSNKLAVDPAFYWTMACNNEFKPVMLPGFEAPFDETATVHHTIEWMKKSGYILQMD